MKQIGKDEYLIRALSRHNSLLDATLKRIAIFVEENTLVVEMEFDMRASSDYQRVTLKFVGVTEYSFYYNANYVFYNVEQVRFLRMPNGLYYLSLDPSEETQGPSNEDQDIVVARSVLGYGK